MCRQCLISIYESLALYFYMGISIFVSTHFIFIPPWNWVDTFRNHYFQLFTQEKRAHQGHISCKRYDWRMPFQKHVSWKENICDLCEWYSERVFKNINISLSLSKVRISLTD